MLYIFLGNLPIYPPTCLNNDLVAQSRSLVKGIAWNWKIIWNIPQIYAPSTDKQTKKNSYFRNCQTFSRSRRLIIVFTGARHMFLPRGR